jgi:hypothetical protein
MGEGPTDKLITELVRYLGLGWWPCKRLLIRLKHEPELVRRLSNTGGEFKSVSEPDKSP